MKPILVIIVGVLLTVNTRAQDPEKHKPKPEATSEVSVTADSPAMETPTITVNYPDCKVTPPKISLQRGLKIAENYITTRRINVTGHYLAKVLLVCDGTGAAIRWEFTWRSKQKPNVDLDVTMNRQARQVPARIQSIM